MTDQLQPGTPGRAPGSPAQVLRILAFAFLTAPILMAAVVWFAIVPATEDLPVWIVALVIALVVAGWITAQTLGFQTEPLTHADGSGTAMDRFRTAMFLRFAVTEAPIIVGMALAFVFPYGPWTFLAALVVGLPAMVHQVWPSRRVVTKFATRLESGGVQSGLLDTFGMR